jgi:predicted transcriptional regulator of viral defense system
VQIESTHFGTKTLTEWAGFMVEHTSDTSWNIRRLKSALKAMGTIDRVLKGYGITAHPAQDDPIAEEEFLVAA